MSGKKNIILSKKRKNFHTEDALSVGNPLAVSLYQAMLKLRSKKDILQRNFMEFLHLRESCIKKADEVWKKTDISGNNLTTFICEFPEHSLKELYYIVVTKEDGMSNVHILLFSFPTIDPSLVDRYRSGKNLNEKELEKSSEETHH